MLGHIHTDPPAPDPDATPADPTTTGASATGVGATSTTPGPGTVVGVGVGVGSGWAVLSAALSEEVAVMSGREDVIVHAAPGAGRGAPACFIPATATIELDGTYLAGIDPATVDPSDPADRVRWPTFSGLLTHEAAHAAHSTSFTAPPATAALVVEAAMQLEEARIEHAHITARPDDRVWLRAVAADLILADYLSAAPTPAPPPPATPEPAATKAPDPDATGPATGGPAIPATAVSVSVASSPAADTAESTSTPTTASRAAPPTGAGGKVGVGPGRLSVWHAATAAALVLARVDAAVLSEAETAPVARVVEATLGTPTVEVLRGLWREALALPDGDTDGLIALAQRWCDTLDLDTPNPGSDGGGEVEPGTGDEESATDGTDTDGTDIAGSDAAGSDAAVCDALREAVASAGRLIREAVAGDTAPGGDAPAPVPHDEDTPTGTGTGSGSRVVRAGDAGAESVFADEAPGAGAARGGTRRPTPAEVTAARVLGTALTTAAARARVVRPSALPPGRLRMRGVIAGEAQRANGALVTAQPFSRTVHRVTPTPPLRLGIACDVSLSMRELAHPAASAAWIVANATRHTGIPTTTATVTFGREVQAITRPGRIPALVTEFPCDDVTEDTRTAIDALDAVLRLSAPDGARLLVMITDGFFTRAQERATRTRITQLRASGCAVLWLAPTRWCATPFPGIRPVALTDPAATAAVIGRAATAALRAATT